MKNLLWTILFGFLILLNNGERLFIKQANALLIDGKNIIFLEIKGPQVRPLMILLIEDVRYILDYKERETT